MPAGDGVVEGVSWLGPDPGKGDRGHVRRVVAEDERDFRAMASWPARDDEVLQGAAESHEVFAAERVERPGAPGGIGVEAGALAGDLEDPWLGVVRAGGEDGGGDHAERTRVISPVWPGVIGMAGVVVGHPVVEAPVGHDAATGGNQCESPGARALQDPATRHARPIGWRLVKLFRGTANPAGWSVVTGPVHLPGLTVGRWPLRPVEANVPRPVNRGRPSGEIR